MQTRLPQACRWVSIAVHYPPPQRARISPSSRRSSGKSLPGRIPLHHLTVTTDGSSFLLLSIILAFHFTTHNCILFSISNDPIAFPGLRREVVFLSFWTGPGAIPPGFGLQRRASHDPPRSFDQSPRDRSEERRVGKECRSRWSP